MTRQKEDKARREKLRDITLLFLELGCIAFGGPAAHIAMMKREVVDKRQWLGQQDFLDLLGATQLIPGPNSTEMAIHLGYERGGWRGLLLAGLGFIGPAVAITLLLAWLYGRYGHLPALLPFVQGLKPAIVAVIVLAVWPLARSAAKSHFLKGLGLLLLVLAFAGLGEIYLLFGAGLAGWLWHLWQNGRGGAALAAWPWWFWQALPSAPLSQEQVFLIFLKIGSILYGSGYVLFAFLDAELVQTGLLRREVLVDAIAVGQFTPGPVFSSVSFIGYQMGGWGTAAAATLGVFLPSFVLVALLGPLMKRLRRSAALAAFLDAVNVGAVAAIAAVCYAIARESCTDWRAILVLVLSLAVGWRWPKLNSALLVIGGALLAYALSFL